VKRPAKSGQIDAPPAEFTAALWCMGAVPALAPARLPHGARLAQALAVAQAACPRPECTIDRCRRTAFYCLRR